MNKWHLITPAIAQQLTQGTTTPGTVFQVGSNAVPDQLQRVPGAVSYFVSSYVQGVPLTPGVTAHGEFALVRHEGDTAKAYNYLLASSSDGHGYFAGPYKNFDAHHFATSKSVPVESLFGNPMSKNQR